MEAESIVITLLLRSETRCSFNGNECLVLAKRTSPRPARSTSVSNGAKDIFSKALPFQA